MPPKETLIDQIIHALCGPPQYNAQHAMMVCIHHREAYASAGDQKRQIFSQWSALSTGRHVTNMWVHWVTVTDHWQEVAWREKGRHLGDETAALTILPLKHRRSLSPDTRSRKRQRHLPSPSVVQLTGSPDRVHEDAPSRNSTGDTPPSRTAQSGPHFLSGCRPRQHSPRRTHLMPGCTSL